MDISNIFRVRSIIRHLRFGELKKDKIIPSFTFFTKIPKINIFSNLSSETGYSEFGLMMEKIIERSLDPCNYSSENVLDFIKCFISLDSVNIDEIINLIKILREHFSLKNVSYQHELIFDCIQGHPDLVTEDTIYEIKTTNFFNRMRVDTILQLLSYYAIANVLYPKKYKNIGLILPSQKYITVVNLENWDSGKFFGKLAEAAFTESQRRILYTTDHFFRDELLSMGDMFVGTHIHKNDLIRLIKMGYNKPLQFFTNGNITGKVEVTNIFRKNLKKAILEEKAKVFIHAPYCLNLSNPRGNYSKDSDDEKIPWTCQKLIYLLELGKECGLKGIVVHCGQWRKKSLTLKNGTVLPTITKEKAIENMIESIHTIALHANKNCPLLIETPAGEKGELFSEKEDFIDFFGKLNESIRDKVGMCIDTCHVFAASYRPDDYIEDVLNNKIQIGLIHYNDSFRECGSKKDQHSHYTKFEGFIGSSILLNVLKVAHMKNIPCVSE